MNDPCLTTAIKSPEDYLSISIYPNPASDEINIIGIKDKTNLKLFDIFGKLLVEIERDNNTTLNTTQFAEGMYTLVIENSGFKTFNKLIITK